MEPDTSFTTYPSSLDQSFVGDMDAFMEDTGAEIELLDIDD